MAEQAQQYECNSCGYHSRDPFRCDVCGMNVDGSPEQKYRAIGQVSDASAERVATAEEVWAWGPNTIASGWAVHLEPLPIVSAALISPGPVDRCGAQVEG